MGCLTSNKPFDSGADPNHDPDSGIFNEILTIAEYCQTVTVLLDQLPRRGYAVFERSGRIFYSAIAYMKRYST